MLRSTCIAARDRTAAAGTDGSPAATRNAAYKIAAMRRSALALATLLAALGIALAGCGGEEEATPSPETVTGTVTTSTETETTETETTATETTGTETETTQTETTETTEPPAQGDPVAGKAVFTGTAGCTGCHTLADAGSTGTVGPNLDDAKPSAELVIDRVTNGQGGMPSFKGQLTDKQIADVAAYVSSVAGS
jgi:cytochrome c6